MPGETCLIPIGATPFYEGDSSTYTALTDNETVQNYAAQVIGHLARDIVQLNASGSLMTSGDFTFLLATKENYPLWSEADGMLVTHSSGHWDIRPVP